MIRQSELLDRNSHRIARTATDGQEDIHLATANQATRKADVHLIEARVFILRSGV
jgi:hypothetical protein